MAWSLDPSCPQEWRRRDDVILKRANVVESCSRFTHFPLLPTTPECLPPTQSTHWGPSLRILSLTLKASFRPLWGQSECRLELGHKGEKLLDIPALLEKAHDSSVSRSAPPSFPVALPSSVAPEGLQGCLWRLGREPPLPHQLADPESRLLMAEMVAFQVSTVPALAMMRDWLWTLASGMDGFSLEELTCVIFPVLGFTLAS